MNGRVIYLTAADAEVPEYGWRGAPEGLATARQLRAAGLRPGGQEPVAVLRKPLSRVFAYLYRVDQAKPKRTASLRQLAACRKATATRHICRACGKAQPYIVPKYTGYECLPCHEERTGG